MKSFVAILAFVAVALAEVSYRSPEADAPILEQSVDVLPDGYEYSYATGNNIQAYEKGVLKNVGREDEALQVEGGNQYTGPDGVVYKTVYVANENGYVAQGAHLPTPPPPQEIPDYILRAIEYNRLHSKPEPQRL